MLYKKDYSNGSFKRTELLGTYLYNRYNKNGIFVDKAKGNQIIKDIYSENEAKDLKAYTKEIEYLFESFEKLENYTNEEIAGEIESLRKNYFKDSYYEKLKIKNQKEIEKSFLNPNSSLNDNFHKIFYTKGEKFRSYINRDELIFNMLEVKDKDLIILHDDLVELTRLLEVLNDANIEKHTIKILVKKVQTINEPTKEWIEYILKEKPQLKNLNIQLLEYENKGLGLNLKNISDEVKHELKNVIQKRSDILVLGENNLFSLTDSNLPYYLVTKVENVTAQTYTNSFLHSDRIPTYVSTFVEAQFKTGISFHGIERRILSLQQYDKLYFTMSEKIRDRYKNNLLNGKLEEGVNSTSPTFRLEIFNELLKNSFEEYLNRYKDEIVNKIAEDEMEKKGLKYINDYYDYDTLKKETFKYYPEVQRNGVLLKGVMVNDPKGLKISTELAENHNAGIISIRELLEKKKVNGNFKLYNNFLYFFTENLQRIYNDLRFGRKKEYLEFKDFYLGYRYEKKEGIAKESFPLYNKGYVGFKNDGRVIFGRKELGGGRLRLGNLELKWDKIDVNNFSRDFTIITPMLLKDEEGCPTKFREFKKLVGRNRYNVIIVNDKIVSMRFGEVVLPSIGVVLSFELTIGKDVVNKLGFKKSFDGYYEVEKKDFYLELDKTSDEKETQWILGGGTLLIKDGVSLMENEKDSYDNFFVEGWHNPLSMQTQETQVQDWVRGPRSVIGITNEGKLFILTFSGRSFETSGARFDEIIKVVKQYFGNVKAMINLDGGASVCFGMILKNEFFELNVPAPSDFNIRGMVRPVNSMIILEK